MPITEVTTSKAIWRRKILTGATANDLALLDTLEPELMLHVIEMNQSIYPKRYTKCISITTGTSGIHVT